jgi:hypothetical protein
VDFALYVDEFQNFSTDSFATIMSEARKYHLNLIVANQFTTQLTEEIRDAVFGNMGTIVSFRVGQNDVEALSRYFQPLFDGDDLLRVPNYNTIVRTLVGGVPTQPFSMATIPPLGNPNLELGQALKQLSAAKYGRPRELVEKEIFGRLKTDELPGSTPPPAANQPVAGGAYPAAPIQSRPGPVAPSTSASFLDQWKARRQQTPASVPQRVSGTPMNSSNSIPRPLNNPSPAQTQTLSKSVSPAARPAAKTSAKVSIAKTNNTPSTVPKSAAGEVNVSLNGSQDKKRSTLGDTIYIDRNGNLRRTST